MLLDPYWRTRSPRALPSGLDWSELRIQLQSNPITSLVYSSLVLIKHGPQVVAAIRERASKAAVPFPTAIFVCSFQFILGSSHTPSTLSLVSGLISPAKPSILIVLARSPAGSLLYLVKFISLYLSSVNFKPCLLDQSIYFLYASSSHVQFS